jgi:hypothetical protein
MKKMLVCLLSLALMAGAAYAGEHKGLMPGYLSAEFQMYQTTVGTDTEWQKDFTSPHVVLWLKGDASDMVKYMAEIWGGAVTQAGGVVQGTDARFFVNQAALYWKVADDALMVKGGLFYFPFGIEHYSLYAPKNKLVTRPMLNTWVDNCMGIVGKVPAGNMKVSYELMLANGTTMLVNDNNSLTFGGRVHVMPNEIVTVGGSFNTGKWDAAGDNARTQFGVHAMAGLGPLDIRGEYGALTREAFVGGNDLSSMNYYAQVAYKLVEATDMLEYFELAFRYDFMDPDTDTDDDQFTAMGLGANLSPAKNLMFKIEYTIMGEGEDAYGAGVGDVDNNEFHFQAVTHW